jgi:hypothetical protein
MIGPPQIPTPADRFSARYPQKIDFFSVDAANFANVSTASYTSDLGPQLLHGRARAHGSKNARAHGSKNARAHQLTGARLLAHPRPRLGRGRARSGVPGQCDQSLQNFDMGGEGVIYLKL